MGKKWNRKISIAKDMLVFRFYLQAEQCGPAYFNFSWADVCLPNVGSDYGIQWVWLTPSRDKSIYTGKIKCILSQQALYINQSIHPTKFPSGSCGNWQSDLGFHYSVASPLCDFANSILATGQDQGANLVLENINIALQIQPGVTERDNTWLVLTKDWLPCANPTSRSLRWAPGLQLREAEQLLEDDQKIKECKFGSFFRPTTKISPSVFCFCRMHSFSPVRTARLEHGSASHATSRRPCSVLSPRLCVLQDYIAVADQFVTCRCAHACLWASETDSM